LENLADRAEIERYLKRFGSLDPLRFAIVKIGGGVLRDDLDEVASALAVLHGMGLYPVVVHGAGPQLDRAVEEAALTSEKVDGMRVTSPEILNIMLKVIDAENLKLVNALGERNAPAWPITGGVFEASYLDDDRLGMVGEVDRVNLESITAAIRAGQIPIVACVGETTSGQILNINADVATGALAVAIRPEKIVFLTPTGGMLDESGNVIPAVNLEEDYERLIRERWVGGGMELKLREIADMLSVLPRASSVSITTPEHLAGELFTDRGSGTLVRRGETIEIHSDLAGLDHRSLHSLLEHAFGRTVVPDYLANLDPHRIYLTTDYSAVAIITEERGMPYLDKFAVTAEAQGLGIGTSLWNRLTEDLPRLFWRARAGNPLNAWYFKKADGSWRSGEWVVFWRGIDTAEEVAACREHATTIPITVDPARRTGRTQRI
jgi:acetylglutamate kinase